MMAMWIRFKPATNRAMMVTRSRGWDEDDDVRAYVLTLGSQGKYKRFVDQPEMRRLTRCLQKFGSESGTWIGYIEANIDLKVV